MRRMGSVLHRYARYAKMFWGKARSGKVQIAVGSTNAESRTADC